MNEKSQRAKVFLSAAQLMVAILLILLAVFLYTGLSTGWFSQSQEAHANGVEVELRGLRLADPKIVSIDVYRPRLNSPDPQQPTFRVFPGATAAGSWTDATWSGETNVLLPGDRIEIVSEFTVLDPPQILHKAGETLPPQDTAVPVEMALAVPPDKTDGQGRVTRASEVPVVQTENGKSLYYYLSSQLWLQKAGMRKNGQTKDTELVPYTNEPPADGSRWLSVHTLGTSAPVKPQTISLGTKTAPRELEPGVYRVRLVLQFYDDPNVNQEPLRGNPVDNPVVPSSFWRMIQIHEIIR